MATNQHGSSDKDKKSGQMKQDMDHNKGGQQGGSKSSNPGNFANDRERASEAGRKGGESSHGKS
ncbi:MULTISPECIES: general stress protein [Haematobacter]|uniref:Stress-induced protein n=2 Tax=Haematobacter TaxID=366614 RepID=A0A086XX86_9RHOB|nr:KGG domain-containing protein [Haematobacter massiliensis]KFI26636.1 stress-induced protein [Haematobacter massiliensis]